MATYTILTDRAVAAVADAYGLKIIRWQPMAGGYENSIFLLSTDQGDFVLTFYEKKSTSDGKLNARLSNHPADHNYHTNQVVPDENGKLVSAYQTRTLVIKAWIPGDTLRDVPKTD
jgi:homoserine kinase type II